MSAQYLYPIQSCDSKRIDSVQVYGPKWSASSSSTSHVRWYHFIFGVLYVYQLGWVASSMGEPYRLFLEKADREGLAVMQGSTVYRAELEHTFGDLNDVNRRTTKLSWTSWMDYDMEELVEEKKKDAQQSVIDSLSHKERVPHKYAPAFLPSLLLGVLATLHALVVLMQHWSVGFLVWMNYQEMDVSRLEIPDSIMDYDYDSDPKHNKNANANSADAAKKATSKPPIPAHKIPNTLPTHARVCPQKEKPVLVELEYFPTLGMTFEYHRRRYLFVNNGNDEYVWTKIRCRTDLPLQFLGQTWKGFAAPRLIEAATIRYGPNVFEVKQPEFLELYKAQLLNPFTVFQLFCVLLWAIDDYIIYSCFSLFMVLLFEGTVVFQRLKSLQALRGMGNPPRPVFVYRESKWTAIESTELLPGDIVSLTRQVRKRKDKNGKPIPDDSGGDVAPSDLLLLRGSTVVNEASLTGESVPQMKEGLADLGGGDDDAVLDMKNKHKMNVVYAGTKMLQCLPGEKVEAITDGSSTGTSASKSIPSPPDGGAVCFVLRTGFSSAQGKLVRMIEGSQEKVKGHERDTGRLLLVLCFFAIASSSYVLYHGLHDEGRSQYELLLHCIMIVTSVIRPELPMQMAMAVNNSLMTLMKMHVFCTEPYRVPMAGKLDACLFDKTGTLTTDELVAVGVLEPTHVKAKKENNNHKKSGGLALKPMIQIHNEAALVMAGCHSLVVYEEETTGDPLEMAALKSIRWHVTAGGKVEPMPAGGSDKKDDNKKPTPAGGPKKIQLPAGQPIKVQNRSITNLEILVRHHFSSKLQRMSCVIQSGSNHYAVAKGSPEAIGNLLENKAQGYDSTAEALAKEGYRVIALAYKPMDAAVVEEAKDSRAKCECGLIFAGFIAFTCRVRKDTASVLKRLKEGGMTVTMVTGDALLTAIHVAKEVYICETVDGKMIEPMDEMKKESDELRNLLNQKKRKEDLAPKSKEDLVYRPILYLDNSDNSLTWVSYETGETYGNYVADEVPKLSKTYDLATTGKCMATAFEYDKDGTRKVLGYFKVFARMTPDAKETVIECLHSVDNTCLMCGDGANDVGALKGADVGVALLSGFGNTNVDKSDEKDEAEKNKKEEPEVTAIISQEHLNQLRQLPVSMIKMKIKQLGVDPSKYPDLIEKEDLVKLYQIKAREVAVKRHDQKNAKDRAKMTKAEQQAEQRRLTQEKQQRMQERVKELEAQGESWAQFKAMKEFMNEEMAAAKVKKGEMVKARGIEGSAASMAAQLDEMDTGDVPVVKLGDASIAAPFTSKMPSIRNCVDIVRQGRCTLVSSIQMYQILALQSLISSYSLSVLYLDGVKYGDTQMTALGLLGSVSFMSVSRSKPLDKLSSVRPLTSIFHPSLFISLLGQFAIHLVTMIVAVQRAKRHLPEDYKPDLDGTFKPGMLNTVVFLVSSVQQVTVFVVNLQGRPFMTSVTDNRPLLWSLLSTFILTFMFASESVPAMNKYFQLIPFPDDATRDFVVTVLVMDLVATYAWDTLMKFIFARHILIASFKETTMADIIKLAKTFGIISFLMYTFLGADETWEEMERAMAELEGTLVENATDVIGDVADTVQECIGDTCEAAASAVEDMVDSIREEF